MLDKSQAVRRVEHSKLIVVRIEEVRCERGMSIAELGRRALIDRKRLWYILDGQRQMRADEFVRICAVLNLGLRSFLTSEVMNDMKQSRLGAATLTGQPLPMPAKARGEECLTR